jgi:hypothetical protein
MPHYKHPYHGTPLLARAAPLGHCEGCGRACRTAWCDACAPPPRECGRPVDDVLPAIQRGDRRQDGKPIHFAATDRVDWRT